jgi:hypothetical protein
MQAKLGGDIGIAERAVALRMRIEIDHEFRAFGEWRRGLERQARQQTPANGAHH